MTAVDIPETRHAQTTDGEFPVPQTVKDLVVGSGLGFEHAGEHELMGFPGHRHLYQVASACSHREPSTWNGDIAIAYGVVGDGPIDLVYIQGYVSDVEMM
ncbi:MAG: hypothetical protein ACRDH7_06820 [Actinomycetota bacterium]